jgi:hypothetical protein
MALIYGLITIAVWVGIILLVAWVSRKYLGWDGTVAGWRW